MKRRFLIAMLVSARMLVAVVILQVAVTAGLAGEAGTWRGTVNQPGSGSYEIIMELDGRGGGSTNYPSLSCGGQLSGGPGNYFESITNNRAVPGGTGGCIDGNISVAVSGDTIFWAWSGSWQGRPYSASATLSRVGRTTQSINETCGRALSNDVTAGLGSSAMLRTYVQQSLGKYANCTRRQADQSNNDCWRINLANLLPKCETFNDAGHRACVNQTVNGANATCQ